jgi:hypothetical protein
MLHDRVQPPTLGKSMASALKSNRADRYAPPRSSPPPQPVGSRAKITPISSRFPAQPADRSAPQKQVVQLRSPARQMPLWLKALLSFQRGTSAIGAGLVAVTLVVYGQTVYFQQRWDKATERLESLRHNERQMTMMMEAVKYNIAAETEASNTGLVPQQPGNFLVLPSASSRPAPAAKAPQTATSFPPPMGY